MTIHQSILIQAEDQAVFDAIAQGLLFELTGASQITNDFKPGGAFQLTFDAGGTVWGNYQSIETSRLELSWNVRGFARPDEETQLAVQIQATGPEQCQLTVTHENVSIHNSELAKSAAWKSILGQLQVRLGKPYQVLEIPFSLNDLEDHFRLAADYSVAELTFSDWQNRTVQVNFRGVFKACIFNANGYRSLPCARLVEVLYSEDVSQLLESGLASPGDDLHHYVLSSNEDRWAEFLASGYSIVVKPARESTSHRPMAI